MAIGLSIILASSVSILTTSNPSRESYILMYGGLAEGIGILLVAAIFGLVELILRKRRKTPISKKRDSQPKLTVPKISEE